MIRTSREIWFRILGVLAIAIAVNSAPRASAALVVDRDLPNTNLNNPASSDRSNVAWGFQTNNQHFSGDDFTLASGLWRIDSLTIWTIAGAPDTGFELGDRFESVTLYGGDASGSISALQSGNFSTGSSGTDNSDITISKTSYGTTDSNGENDYQGTSGSYIQIWEVTFNNLNWVVEGGVSQKFGVHGLANNANSSAVWSNHASNAALSGTTQDDADNQYRWFNVNNLAGGGFIDSDVNGWDKSSDINVRVTATAVPEPSTLAMGGMAVAMAGLGAWRRRRRAD